MTLDRALEMALEACDYLSRQGHHDSKKFADALPVLRAFMEKGLPFYRAAEEMALDYDKRKPGETPYSDDLRKVVAAYRAMKEGK